jgi:hypothetical protein
LKSSHLRILSWIKIRTVSMYRIWHRWLQFNQIVRSQLCFQTFNFILKSHNIILHLHEALRFTIFKLTLNLNLRLCYWLWIDFLIILLNVLWLVQNMLSIDSFKWHRIWSRMISWLNEIDNCFLMAFYTFKWIFFSIS